MTLRPRLFLPVVALALAALMALVAPSIARADTLTWIQTYSSPQHRTVNEADVWIGAAFNAVSFSGSSGWGVGLIKDNVYATGTYTSLIAHSLDGGGAWQVETVASADELYGVAALSPTNAWAVGANGLILHYVEGSWTSQRLAGWSGKALRAIGFSGLTGWAVGDGLGIARTTDGGLSWSTFRSPSGTATLRSVAGLGVSETAVAVGDGGRIEYIDFVYAHAQSAPSVNLRGVTFTDTLSGWAVGDSATILRTSNGGLTWLAPDTSVPTMPGLLPSQSSIRAVAFADASNGIAVGQYQGVWRTSDGGATWAVEKLVTQLPDSGNYSLRGASFAGPSADVPIVVGRSNGDDTLTNPDQTARAYRGTWTLPLTRMLTYIAGTGGMIVGVSPQTVDPGGSGSTVTARPAIGYHFVAWSDGVATAARTDANVTVNKIVTANFAINTYELAYAAGAHGRITGTSPQTTAYGANGSLVTAVPDAGYHFVAWSDGVTTAARTDTNVRSGISVAANFAIDTYTLTYTAGAGGTIIGTSPQTVASGSDGAPVTAVPDAGYHFVAWSDEVATAARTDANVTGNITVKAVFAATTPGGWTLTYLANPGGSISGISPQAVAAGGDGTPVTAVPAIGYHFVAWSDGVTTAPRTETNVTADLVVSASFANTWTLTYSHGIGGTVNGASPQTVAQGGDGTLVTAVSLAGYRFSAWSDGLTTAVRTDMGVAADINVAAIFVPAQIATKLTMNASPTRLSAGHLAHFYGVMAPNMPNGTPIALLVRKAGQTKWSRAGSYVRTYSSHHWSRYYHPNTRGTYYFKVQFLATATHAGTYSRTVTVVWR